MTTEKVLAAAERYLSRQPHCESDEDCNPLYTRNQLLRAFCAGEIASIDVTNHGSKSDLHPEYVTSAPGTKSGYESDLYPGIVPAGDDA